MCIKNWFRRLFRRRREGDPIRRGNAVYWNLIGEKRVNFPLRNTAKELLADWAARKVDDMIMAEARAGRKILGDSIYINRISQLLDKDKKDKGDTP